MAREQYEQATKEFSKLMQTFEGYTQNRRELLTQLNENEAVEEELKLLRDGCTLYKVVGPVLVKQSHSEARNTVTKRLQYIRAEIERCEKIEEEISVKVKETGNKIAMLGRKAAEEEMKHGGGKF